MGDACYAEPEGFGGAIVALMMASCRWLQLAASATPRAAGQSSLAAPFDPRATLDPQTTMTRTTPGGHQRPMDGASTSSPTFFFPRAK